MMFLPTWFPLNIYDLGCWARQTIVPLTIVSALEPVRPVPFGIDELTHRDAAAADGKPWTLGRLLPAARPRAARLRAAAAPAACGSRPMRRAAEWILARQEADGGWGGIQPPWVYSLIALHLLGYPLDHPAMRAGLEGLDGFTDPRGDAGRTGPAARGVPVAGVGHRRSR